MGAGTDFFLEAPALASSGAAVHIEFSLCYEGCVMAALNLMSTLLMDPSLSSLLASSDCIKLAQALSARMLHAADNELAQTQRAVVTGIMHLLVQRPQHAAPVWQSDAPAALLTALAGADPRGALPWQQQGTNALVILEATMLLGAPTDAAASTSTPAVCL
jgi:hypothetical protein